MCSPGLSEPNCHRRKGLSEHLHGCKEQNGLLWLGHGHHYAQTGSTTFSGRIPQAHRATEKATWSLTTHEVCGQPRAQDLPAKCKALGFMPSVAEGIKEQKEPKKGPPAVQSGGYRPLGWK